VLEIEIIKAIRGDMKAGDIVTCVSSGGKYMTYVTNLQIGEAGVFMVLPTDNSADEINGKTLYLSDLARYELLDKRFTFISGYDGTLEDLIAAVESKIAQYGGEK